MKKNWRVHSIPEGELLKLGHLTGIPPLLLRIIWNRNLREPAEIERFFEGRSRHLSTPFLLDEVGKAIDRIFQAIESEERIRIFGDRDVDGITSTVILFETLKTLTKGVDYTIPVIEEGYGLNREYLEVAKREGITLLITVDCGISNVDEIKFAKELGIDIIVTDHHEPPQVIPDAHSIIDPKLLNPDFPCKFLAGVGVAFKLSMALVLAACQSLSNPIISIDHDGIEIDALGFSPRGGFFPIKQLNSRTLGKAKFLFWSKKEQKAVFDLIPDIEEKPEKCIYLSELLTAHVPDIGGEDFSKASLDLCIPSGVLKAKRLLLMYLKLLEFLEPDVNSLWKKSLDILSIGTIADMVSLTSENRVMVQMGLKFITQTKRLGLLELFNELRWKQKNITEREVSWNIAPILNASGRLKSAELAIELLITEFPPKAKALAHELFELNNKRKSLATDCLREVKKLLLSQNDVEKEKILLVSAPIPNQGVTGIVATRLVQEFCKPVIVLLEDHGKLLGSARGFKNINVINILNFCSDLIEKYGGHVSAAGISISPGNLESFRYRLKEYASMQISDEDLEDEWLIDSEISIDEIDDQLLSHLMKFAPFGIDNPSPMFMAKNVHFYEARKVGELKNHLRFRFKRQNGQSLMGIGFNIGTLLSEDVLNGGLCDLVFSIDLNDYNGIRSIQLVVYDIIFQSFHRAESRANEAN